MASASSPPPSRKSPVAPSTPPAPPAALPNPPATPGTLFERIRKCIVAIDQHHQTSSTLRGAIGSLYRFCAPSMKLQSFPRTLRRHPANPDRSVEFGKSNLVLHTITNALQSVYEVLKAGKAPAGELVEKAEARVVKLETIVKADPEDWRIEGNDGDGFHLIVR